MSKHQQPRRDDWEAESEREPLPPPDPVQQTAKEKYWRDQIDRVGRSDDRGGVFRLPGFDHDGRSISAEEERELDRAIGNELTDDDLLLRDDE